MSISFTNLFSLSAPGALEEIDSHPSEAREEITIEEAVRRELREGLLWIVLFFDRPIYRDCLVELERVKVMLEGGLGSNLWEQKECLLRAREQIINALEKIPADELRELKPQSLPKIFEPIWESAWISSWIRGNPNSLGYGEHQVFFKALFGRLVSLGEMERAGRITEQFEAAWPRWKTLTAKQSILEGLLQKQHLEIFLASSRPA